MLIDKGNIFIWGWHPQLYVLSYLYPSDRATITQKYMGAIGEKDQVNAFSNIKYFNNRLMNDIKNNKPNVIYDFVKPKSFII